MPAVPLPPEDQAKLDAWVGAIRQLARDHRVAHTLTFTNAIKATKTWRVWSTMETIVEASSDCCIEAGIPEEEVVAIRTLIFG